MTRDMGVALAKQGIRVNALCPGFTYTALTKTMTNLPQMRAKLEALHPMGRLAEPGEIAQASTVPCFRRSVVYHRCMPCSRWWLHRTVESQKDNPMHLRSATNRTTPIILVPVPPCHLLRRPCISAVAPDHLEPSLREMWSFAEQVREVSAK